MLVSCSSLNFRYTTLNHVSNLDGIYTSTGDIVDVNVIENQWEFDRLLRTDFQFRYNYAQYAISQPLSFDWNNRFFRINRYNSYNFYNQYNWGYSSFWNRDQMWMDWVWGYPYGNGIGWSYSWGNNSWSSNHWNNPYGWNSYYGWNTGVHYSPNYNRRDIALVNGRRTSIRIPTAPSSLSTNTRRIINTNTNDQTIRINPRSYQRTESSGNGGGSRVRQVLPIKPIVPRFVNPIQPGQVRGGSKPPVPQQIRTSSSTDQQRRSSSTRGQN